MHINTQICYVIYYIIHVMNHFESDRVLKSFQYFMHKSAFTFLAWKDALFSTSNVSSPPCLNVCGINGTLPVSIDPFSCFLFLPVIVSLFPLDMFCRLISRNKPVLRSSCNHCCPVEGIFFLVAFLFITSFLFITLPSLTSDPHKLHSCFFA